SYFIHDSLPHPATFIKASLFKKIDFYDEKLKIVADWKFFLECVCKYNVSYLKINKTLASFNLNGLSSSEAGKEIIREEKMLVLRSNFNAYLKDSDRLSKLETLLSELRNSKKLKLLVKFGFLNKF